MAATVLCVAVMPRNRKAARSAAAATPQGGDREETKASADAPRNATDLEYVKRNRGRPLAKVVHSAAHESLLSVSVTNTDHQGFVNLFAMVLVCANLRLIVENVMKYGIRVALPTESVSIERNWQCVVCHVFMVLIFVVAWAVERFLAPIVKSDRVVNGGHVLCWLSMFFIPFGVIRACNPSVSGSVVLVVFSISWTMKLISFGHTCFDIRRALARGILDQVCQDAESRKLLEGGFPRCLRLKDMMMFVGYPTLCYQLHYPRSPRVRYGHLLKRIGELALCLAIQYILIEQYITPLLENTRKYLSVEPSVNGSGDQVQIVHFNVLGFLERLLKLSLPNLYVWLLLFFALFHCWLNILAEVTRFADRKFYSDWWNAASFGEYWQRWNLPVHHWFMRHVYSPMLRRKWSRLSAGLTVFMISGVLHEYLVVAPLQMTRPTILVMLAFVGQLPLTIITSRALFEKHHRVIGNMIFWVVFCFSGQPMAVLVYFLLAATPNLATFGSFLSLR
mmetsp:Transcript_62056/g.133861  ORF Transcript_62056/g.133861 Transcript_62056/m.133861 type:complete len:506 (+) Transcript_62056:3-1520(+)